MKFLAENEREKKKKKKLIPALLLWELKSSELQS